MNLETLESTLNELTNQFKSLKTELANEKTKVQTMPLVIREVFPGDVWVFPPNKGCKWGHLCTVKSVNKEKNRVELDDGWNPLDNMLAGQWVLVSRELTKEVKQKAMEL